MKVLGVSNEGLQSPPSVTTCSRGHNPHEFERILFTIKIVGVWPESDHWKHLKMQILRNMCMLPPVAFRNRKSILFFHQIPSDNNVCILCLGYHIPSNLKQNVVILEQLYGNSSCHLSVMFLCENIPTMSRDIMHWF